MLKERFYATDESKIKRLKELGHFDNPELFEEGEISNEDIAKMTKYDHEVHLAMRSFEGMMEKDMHQLSLVHHYKTADIENGLGAGDPSDPALADLFEVPRCGYPDYLPKQLIQAGSWQEQCARVDGVTVDVDSSRAPAKTKASFELVKTRVRQAFWAIGCKLIDAVAGRVTNINMDWRSLFGSTIGYASLHAGSCNSTGFCQLDSGFDANIEAIMELWTHEHGHNMNLGHKPRGIMTASLGSVVKFEGWTENDPATATLRNFFPWGPIPFEPEPGPGPGPGPFVVDFRQGTIYVNNSAVLTLPKAVSGMITYEKGQILANGKVVKELIGIPPF